MKIEHVAIWTNELERLKLFYIKYFNATSNEKYHNVKKKFSSYFLTFDEGCRLEIMEMDGINEKSNPANQYIGFCHIAFKLNSKDEVIKLTNKLLEDKYSVVSEPKTTGDGYFESVILDPDGNRVEIVS